MPMGKLAESMQLEISLGPTEDEIRVQALREGMWDSVKDGLKALSDKVTAAFKPHVAEWGNKIKEIVDAGRPKELQEVVAAVVEASKATGETIPWDDTLRAAKEFGQLTPDQATKIAQEDLEGPVKEKAASVKEGKYISGLYRLIRDVPKTPAPVNESLTLTSVLGVGFALLGGIPMVLKGLYKLAEYLGAEKTAAILKKAHHFAHKVEEKTIDWMVPDRLSWAIYMALQKRGIKAAAHKLTYEEFKANKGGAKLKIEGLVYKVILIYFAFSGITSALHAGASLLGFVEGGTSAVKGIELASGAMEIANIAKGGALVTGAGIAASSV